MSRCPLAQRLRFWWRALRLLEAQRLRRRSARRRRTAARASRAAAARAAPRAAAAAPAAAPRARFGLTAAECTAVTALWGAGASAAVVAVGANNLQLTRHDVCSLRGTSWANDEVINFYLQLVTQLNARQLAAAPASGPVPPLPRVHAFSSFFWTRLACGPGGYDYAAVRRWTKKLDVYAFDLLLVPMNHRNVHWTLAAIWPRRRLIEHYDSLGHGSGERASERSSFAALARYMADEAADKVQRNAQQGWPGAGGDASRWAATARRVGVPRQGDGSACGVFAASMAARLAAGRGTPFRITQADVPALRMRIAADCVAGAATPLHADE